jgi:O-antigen ligase
MARRRCRDGGSDESEKHQVMREMGIRYIVLSVLHLSVLLVVTAIAFLAISDLQMQTRGVTYGAAVGDPAGRPNISPFGVNASLGQYSDDDLRRALGLIRDGGFYWVRQHFYWNEIEPRQGEFQWNKWDRLVARVDEYGLHLMAVLDTTPAWARHPGEADRVNAPPANVDDYARFVAAFARRYGDRVRYLQIWDNPNVHPFWGRRNADPFEYAALLRAGAVAARAVNPQMQIISAGLAPNAELIRGHPDYSDILFLRGMYEAGAREYFDIVGAKPYGMWSGPEDRRVSPDVFNFSRVILLRDEMLAHGDAAKPIWAVEFGWNALPQDWRGAPSSWGTDTEETQSARFVSAVQRARSEWPWMTALVAQTFQPNAPSDDSLWGFALIDKSFQPRMFYSALTRAMVMPVQPASFDFPRYYAALAVLLLVATVAAWRGAVAVAHVPLAEGWSAIKARFAALPEAAQFALLGLSALVFYYSRNVALNFALLVLLVFLFALRLDLGLVLTVFTIPFYLLPKNLIGSMQFSMVEVLTLVAVIAWALRQVTSRKLIAKSWNWRLGAFDFTLFTFDLAVLFFVFVGILSVKIAANFGVANREFRVIVMEPALLYGLIRAAKLTRRDLWRLVDAFVLSALVVSLIGLYQYFLTDYVIIGEGVRRILAVYGSPNNLALYLDRALPLVIALALFAKERRIAYALAAIPIALCLYLTYSRGAWLLGLPAGLVFIGLMSGRRARLAIAALLIVGAIVLIPFLRTERAQSLFQAGTGTAFFRVSVWESAAAMIRDHPIVGVGLDNFLYEYSKYMKPEAWREPNLSHPHNIVLDFWARMGILGVGALAWIVFEFYRAGLKKLARSDRALVLGLMASMTGALAHGMIDAAYFYVDLAFVFMMSFGVMMELID